MELFIYILKFLCFATVTVLLLGIGGLFALMAVFGGTTPEEDEGDELNDEEHDWPAQSQSETWLPPQPPQPDQYSDLPPAWMAKTNGHHLTDEQCRNLFEAARQADPASPTNPPTNSLTLFLSCPTPASIKPTKPAP